MAMDQPALLELSEELKVTDVGERIPVLAEAGYQASIDEDASRWRGSGPCRGSGRRSTTREPRPIDDPSPNAPWPSSQPRRPLTAEGTWARTMSLRQDGHTEPSTHTKESPLPGDVIRAARRW